MQSNKVKQSMLPFPTALLNADIEVYEVTETEADGEQKALVYEGRAYYEHKAKTTERTKAKGSGISGLIVIHGGFSHKTPFRGSVVIGGTEADVLELTENEVLGGIYTTELMLK